MAGLGEKVWNVAGLRNAGDNNVWALRIIRYIKRKGQCGKYNALDDKCVWLECTFQEARRG
jgi:hypothetical protein